MNFIKEIMQWFTSSVNLITLNNQKQEYSLNLLFQELNSISNDLMNLRKSAEEKFIKTNNLVRQKVNLFSKLRYEIVMNITLFLNATDILKLRRLNQVFNKLILQSLPIRIEIYNAQIQNLEEKLRLYPDEQINLEIKQYQLEINLFDIIWEQWDILEIAKIYGAKELPESVFLVLKCLSVAVLDQIPKNYSLELFKQVIGRQNIMYEIPHYHTILSQKKIDILREILQIDPLEVGTYSQFCRSICEILQNYVHFCDTNTYKQLVINYNTKKKLIQFQQKLKVFIKLSKKYNFD